MCGVTRTLAYVEALHHKRLFRDALHLRVLKKALIELAGTAPRRGKHQQNILVLSLCLGFCTGKQGVGGFLLRLKCGYEEDGCESKQCGERKFPARQHGSNSFGMALSDGTTGSQVYEPRSACPNRSGRISNQSIRGLDAIDLFKSLEHNGAWRKLPFARRSTSRGNCTASCTRPRRARDAPRAS